MLAPKKKKKKKPSVPVSSLPPPPAVRMYQRPGPYTSSESDCRGASPPAVSRMSALRRSLISSPLQFARGEPAATRFRSPKLRRSANVQKGDYGGETPRCACGSVSQTCQELAATFTPKLDVERGKALGERAGGGTPENSIVPSGLPRGRGADSVGGRTPGETGCCVIDFNLESAACCSTPHPDPHPCLRHPGLRCFKKNNNTHLRRLKGVWVGGLFQVTHIPFP